MVSIGMIKTVRHLKNAIAKAMKRIIKCDPNALQLYLAKMDNVWLVHNRDTAQRLETAADDILPMLTAENKMLSTSTLKRALVDEKNMPTPQAEQIHVLVVVPGSVDVEACEGRGLSAMHLLKTGEEKNESVRTSQEPPTRKPNLDRSHICYQGRLGRGHISVPLETIRALQQIKTGFSLPATTPEHPLFLLYGPPMFGKSTISYRVSDWLKTESCVADVHCVRIVLNEMYVKEEERFWSELAWTIDLHNTCADEEAFVKVDTCGQKRFCLIFDDMDCIFYNAALAVKLLEVLHRWKSAPYFCGFLGIGSYGLVHDYLALQEVKTRGFFSEVTLVAAQPFSEMQMKAFFELIESRYLFPKDLQRGIMKYSSGALGVFVSIIRCTLELEKWSLKWHDWEPWFKIDVFWVYCNNNHFSDFRIQNELINHSEFEWKPLIFILQNDGILTENDIENNCASSRRTVEHLLKMGVSMKRNDGKLSVVCELLYCLCVEVLPVRNVATIAISVIRSIFCVPGFST